MVNSKILPWQPGNLKPEGAPTLTDIFQGGKGANMPYVDPEKRRKWRKTPKARAAARAAQKRYRRKHPDKVRARHTRYRANNRAKVLAAQKRRYAKNNTRRCIQVINALARKDGLPQMDPATVTHKPLDGRCQLCHKPKRRLGIDHDHKTGRFRGWLCHNCNSAIGLLGEDVELLERVIAYLKVYTHFGTARAS